MPYFATSQEWLRQSALLLEARPTSTRITTTYNISKPRARKADDPAAAAAKPPRGSLVIKTYDPVSGSTLKYRTTKAAEVSRLVLSLGRLGNRMAGLPSSEEDDVVMGEAVAAAEETTTTTPAATGKEQPQQQPTQQQPQPQQGGGGGGKGKKKKGKK